MNYLVKPRLALLASLALLVLLAASARLQAATPTAQYWPGDQVDASFAKGGVLIETDDYKVHTSRRVAPGQVEVHTRDTDIIHVIEGSATFVTGGTLKDGREIAPEEIRGTQLDGGTTQILRKGDVVIVPNGTPHWFKAVEGPVLYYTVKVRAAAVPATAVTPSPSPPTPLPTGVPAATLNLATPEGLGAVKAQWRYSDTRVVEAPFRSVGSDRKPSGPPNRTYDIKPHAEGIDFDDSGWAVLDPTTLDARRSSGKVCFNWYRLKVTVPETIGGVATTGAALVFSVTVDDYAELWVDGRLDRQLGQAGGGVVAGWNVPNRVVVARDARPGQVVQLALFGINGPISAAPENYIWIRDARLELFNAPRAVAGRTVPLQIERLDPAIDGLIPPGAQLEQVAEGFRFTEGPIWQRAGFLLFSDPNANTIYRWHPTEGLSVFRTPSGYSGADIAEYGQPGSNGLTLDAEGRLTLCEHGNHRIARLERDGDETTLADQYEGRRLNSPNDLVYRSDGTLYFTDPPFGLPKFFDDPRKELPFSGVFSWRDDHTQLLSSDLTGPNGLAFSPDEKFLYVTNWDTAKKVVMRYAVRADGSLTEGRVFFDMTNAPGEEALDGIKVDRKGNLYVSGPGGLWILNADGRHLGTLKGPELAANFAWGDDDGRGLYLTARTGVYHLRVNVPGVGAIVNPVDGSAQRLGSLNSR